MTSKVTSDLFPGWDRQQVPPDVEAELAPGEELLWLGGPDRWGLFRATPFVVALLLVVGISTYISVGTGLTLWEYAARLLGTMGLAPQFVGLGLVGLFAVLLGLSLRDPRPRWNYVVTDRRMITFYRGEKLREANIGRMNRLRVLQGIEGRLRNIGDVLWSPVSNVESNSGPDRGRHGFRGMRDPKTWQQRLQTWGQAVERTAAGDAGELRKRVSDSGSAASSTNGARTLTNRRYGFAMTIPERWVGRIGFQETKPLSVLGMKLPTRSIDQVSNQPLHDPPDNWNYIEIQGRSRMKFTININAGPPESSFDAARAKAGEAMTDADGDLQLGPLNGYRVDYRHLGMIHVRQAALEGDGFHIQATVVIPAEQAADLLPAIDAVFESIQAA